MRLEVKVLRVQQSGSMDWTPAYATPGAAGLDLRAAIPRAKAIQPGSVEVVPTGIAIELPGPHVAGFVFSRSGLSSKHLVHLVNGVGVIDSDYTGEIMCPMTNGGKKPYMIEPGDRIAQIVFMPVYLADLTFVTELTPSQRGEGGFGHTGR